MAEERGATEETSVGDALEEWREAEREADAQEPDTAAHAMARKRADAARDEFHEAEDEAREPSGNDRQRQRDSPEGDPEPR